MTKHNMYHLSVHARNTQITRHALKTSIFKVMKLGQYTEEDPFYLALNLVLSSFCHHAPALSVRDPGVRTEVA